MILFGFLWRLWLFFGLWIFVLGSFTYAQENFSSVAKFAILQDFETGEVLYAKNVEARMYPASMTKLMTTYLLFEELASGRLSLDDEFSISAKARSIGGSRMFVEQGDLVTVEDLARGIIVQSGNDASVAVAENIAGDELSFAKLMNAKASMLGMSNSHFVNASGWPDDDHYTTARDLLTLTVATIRDFPQFYPYYSEKNFTYNSIRQGNRNPLLYDDSGSDGLKTGYTKASGYGIVASAFRGDRRLLMVINGLDSANQRADEARRLIAWGFRAFDNYRLLDKGDSVGSAEVWLGEKKAIPLLVQDDIFLTLPKHQRQTLEAHVVYDSPLLAPVVEGQQVAVLQLADGEGEQIAEFPVYSGESVEELSLAKKMPLLFDILILGKSQ